MNRVRKLNRLAAIMRGYWVDMLRLDVADDKLRQEIFARQLEATTTAVRWLAPVLVLVTLLTVLLFWGSGNRPFLLSGELINCATCAFLWFKAPRAVTPDAARQVAMLHLAGAAIHGCGIAIVSLGVSYDPGVHTAMFNSCWRVAFISVGLGFYVNLPLAFFVYATPILLPFMWAFLAAHDRTSVVVPFALIYILVLTRMGVDQNRMFVAAGRNALRLQEAETAAREGAEERMRLAEKASVDTLAAAEARRAETLALAERFEHDIVSVADGLSSTVDALDRSAKQMVDVTRYSASTAEDVAARTADVATSLSTVATAANELAQAIASIAAQIEDHATLSARATRSATDSETRIAVVSEEAEHVSTIAALIKGITAQTKLLALNATIEAARAGDAGRGFAIVAQEVKTLAHHTSEATSEVTTRAASILSRIDPAVASIRSTAKEIDGVAVIAGTIASSIAQQRHASEEIDRETDTVAHHVDDIRHRMADLVERANHAGTLTTGVSGAAEQVSEQADMLQRAAAEFLRELRAA